MHPCVPHLPEPPPPPRPHRDYLLQHGHRFPYVLLTDVSDAYLMQNPFPFMARHAATVDLFVCPDLQQTIGQNKWMKWHYFQCLQSRLGVHYRRPVLNTGCVGGRTDVVLQLLRGICRVLYRAKVPPAQHPPPPRRRTRLPLSARPSPVPRP